jgi:hypothetical protein
MPDAGLQVQAAQVFAGDLAADREPSVRAIRAASCRAARQSAEIVLHCR